MCARIRKLRDLWKHSEFISGSQTNLRHKREMKETRRKKDRKRGRERKINSMVMSSSHGQAVKVRRVTQGSALDRHCPFSTHHMSPKVCSIISLELILWPCCPSQSGKTHMSLKSPVLPFVLSNSLALHLFMAPLFQGAGEERILQSVRL